MLPALRASDDQHRVSAQRQPPSDEPPEFYRLTELAVPEPATEQEPRSSGEENAYLEDQRTVTKGRTDKEGRRDANISELVVPPPAEATESRDSRFLEDVQGGETIAQPPSDDPSTTDADDLELESTSRRSRDTSRYLTEAYTVSYLILFSILGTLSRLGVQWLTFYPGAVVVTPVLWANVGGSFFMGFLAEDRMLFRNYAGNKDDKDEIAKVRKTVPLYIGLSTGFCGSFTSFSTFIRDAFLALANRLPTPLDHSQSNATPLLTPATLLSERNAGYSVQGLLAVLICTLALSLSALVLGAHVALLVRPIMPGIPSKAFSDRFDAIMMLVCWGSLVVAVLLTIWSPTSRGVWDPEVLRGEVLFAIVFAPVGSLTRFYVSLQLNGMTPSFPLGTFVVNITAVAIEGMLYDLQRVRLGPERLPGNGILTCQTLQGLQDGFCGCLSTVSTWVAEIRTLKRKHGYLYALTSIVGGVSIMIAVMGGVVWSLGWSEPACNTGYPSKAQG